MIAMQRIGIPYNITKSLFLPLQLMEHNITTGFGTSEETYSSQSAKTTLQGILQGNGNGPSAWAVLSSLIFHLMKSKGFGANFTSMISKITTEFVGYGFVDDVDLVLTEDKEIIFEQAQEGLNTWEGGLHATGGALQISKDKTFYYVISFKRINNKWEYTDIHDIPGNLYARDDQGSIKKLQREEVSKANETLGTFLAPNGDMTKQIEKLKHKADQFAASIQTRQNFT